LGGEDATGPERVQKTGSRPRTRKRVAALLATAGATVLLAACGSSGKGPVTLNWYVFPEPSGSFQAAATECSQGSHGAYNIKISFLSTSSDQQRVSLVRRLAANDSSIDILAMDVDWTAEFATAKWLKPVPASLAAQIKSQDLAGPDGEVHLPHRGQAGISFGQVASFENGCFAHQRGRGRSVVYYSG